MNIIMMTNIYKPFVGGVERSVDIFSEKLRELGHKVLIIAPEFENQIEEPYVIRVPAIQKFNGTDFSVKLPIAGILSDKLDNFKPDIVHSHHPFLIGSTAIRVAHKFNIPLIFTNHTLYEQYTHYVPGDSLLMKRFVIELSVGYANLCCRVIAPSASIADLLRKRGVQTRIDVVPTGICIDKFANGNGNKIRKKFGIGKNSILLGFVSRLAREKNLDFLSSVAAMYLQYDTTAHFLIAGKGPVENDLKDFFSNWNLSGRVHFTGLLESSALADAYNAMDLFIFASKTETQGIVLTEAMASGVPVIALEASGVVEVVKDKINGRLISHEDKNEFFDAIKWFAELSKEQKQSLKNEAKNTSRDFSIQKCADMILNIYREEIDKGAKYYDLENSPWNSIINLIRTEWNIISNVGKAVNAAVGDNKNKTYCV